MSRCPESYRKSPFGRWRYGTPPAPRSHQTGLRYPRLPGRRLPESVYQPSPRRHCAWPGWQPGWCTWPGSQGLARPASDPTTHTATHQPPVQPLRPETSSRLPLQPLADLALTHDTAVATGGKFINRHPACLMAVGTHHKFGFDGHTHSSCQLMTGVTGWAGTAHRQCNIRAGFDFFVVLGRLVHAHIGITTGGGADHPPQVSQGTGRLPIALIGIKGLIDLSAGNAVSVGGRRGHVTGSLAASQQGCGCNRKHKCRFHA